MTLKKLTLVTAALLALVTFEVSAQVVCPPTTTTAVNAALVCWTNATLNEDGTTIPAIGPLSLKTTTIQRAQVAATASCDFTTIAQTLNVTPDVTTVLFENLTAGKQCFRARHVNEAGTNSAYSAMVSKVTTVPAPVKTRPPTISIF